MTLETPNVWPEGFDGEVVFILDAETSVEKTILDDYLQTTLPASTNWQAVDVSLRNDESQAENAVHIESVISNNQPQFFVPLRVVWKPKKQPVANKGLAIKELLFGARSNPSKLTQTVLQKQRLRKNDGSTVQVAVGKGASLLELQNAFEKSSLNKRSNANKLSEHITHSAFLALERSERSISGARYKIPRLVNDEVLGSPTLKARLNELHQATGVDEESLEKQAEDCLKEMAATPTPAGLDLVAELGRFMYTRGFEEQLDYLPEELERVRQLLSEKPVAFVFTHKSHIDGFLLYTLFHDLNLPPVHTFGGINMGFMGLGAMLRNAGAIFIRRSFSNDEVYKSVFKHYIDYLGKKRFPVMWSLEGTRSRTGKLMPPRFGLLNYVVSAYLRDEEPDLVIMPISIIYDQIPEVSDYDALQAGAEKRKESALWFLQYLKGLKNPYGKIHIRFGKGLAISDYIDTTTSATSMDRREMQKLAFDLAVDVNNATPITVNSLICYVLLENGHRAMSFNQLRREIDRLLAFIAIYQFPMTEQASSITNDVLQQALQQLSVTGVIDITEEGIDVLYMIPYGGARIAAYYRNGLIQFFITSAIGELALLAVKSTGEAAIEEFHKEALQIRDLMKYEFFFEGSDQFIALLESQFDQRIAGWREAVKQGREAIRAELQKLDILIGHSTLRPFLDAYAVFARALSLVPAGNEIDTKALMKQSLAVGQQGVLQQRIHCEESVSQSYFENAVKIAEGLGLYEQGQDAFAARLVLLNQLWALIANTRFLASVADSKRHDELTALPLDQLG